MGAPRHEKGQRANEFLKEIIENIINYKKDPAIASSNDDAFVVTKGGMKQRRKTTQG